MVFTDLQSNLNIKHYLFNYKGLALACYLI